MSHIVSVLFFVLIGVMLVNSVRRRWKNRRFVWEVWSGFRPLMLIEILVVLAATVTVAVLLDGIGAPFSWGWYKLLTGHSGNVGVTPILDVGRSGYVLLWAAAIGVFCLLLVLMPFFAHSEEVDFRKGRETWKRILPTSLKFGLWHMWVGVPLSVGIALSLPGLYFAWKYTRAIRHAMRADADLSLEDARDAGIYRSTVCHTLYNSVIMLLIFIILMREF